MSVTSVTQDLKLRFAVIRGKEIIYVNSLAKSLKEEITDTFPVAEGTTTLTSEDLKAEDRITRVEKYMNDIKAIKDDPNAPTTREEWYTRVFDRFKRAPEGSPLSERLQSIRNNLRVIQTDARRASDQRKAAITTQNPQVQNAAMNNSGSCFFDYPAFDWAPKQFYAILAKDWWAVNESTHPTYVGYLDTQNATLGSDIPQLNIGQSQNISGLGDTTAPQISASDPANSGRVPEQIVPWDEFNRVHELILTPEQIARGMRLAPASRSNHSLSSVGRGSVNSIPGPAVGNYNEVTRHNNVVNTGNNYASGYVPGHAHHLSVNTTHTTNTFGDARQCVVFIRGLILEFREPASSVSPASDAFTDMTDIVADFIDTRTRRHSYVQPDGQASTSTRSSPYGQVPYGGQSEAGSSGHSSHAHGY
ncbi:uncharacterized protein ARMOST_15038 [Armillaria ostoyae]|uniref:Uncharacterized protein n=1 Tax=Armillaria ostoyae TaxID=47428 RepID=A0A284RS94_ARMOS|nr:uncharacterized protein ARMOST_15038 [Armillaria ostoyae]